MLTMMLAVVISITTLSTPINVYASNTVVGDNGGGGNGSMGTSSDYKAWSSNHQGYRFYIINSNLERVTDVYDFLFSTPSNVGKQIYSTRFDGTSTPTNHDTNNTMLISTLASKTDSSVSDIPYPVKNNAGHGEEFKEWFLRNIPASSGGGGNIIISGGSSGNNGNTSNSNNNQENNTGYNGEEIITGDPTTYPSNVHASIRVGRVLAAIDITEVRKTLSADEGTEAAGKLYSASNVFKQYYKYAVNDLGYMTDTECVNYALGKVYSFVTNCSDINYNQRLYICKSVYQCRNSLISEISGLAYVFNTNSLLNQNIPLSGTESVEGCPVLDLLTDTTAIKVSGYASAMEAIKDDHYLVVEPICWLYIPSNGTNYPSSRTYGSYYNLAEEWVRLGGRDTGGFYTSYMTELGNNCLTVNSEITTETGKTIKGASIAKRNISQSLIEMQSMNGISLHVYSSDMLTEQPPEPEVIEMSGDWVLNESEISKPVSTGTKTSEQVMKYSYTCLDSCDGHKYCGHSCNNNCANNNSNCKHTCSNTCKSKSEDGKTCTHSHTSSCKKYYCGHSSTCNSCAGPVYCDFEFDDSSYSLKLKNTQLGNYPTVVANIAGSSLFTYTDNTISATRDSLDDGTLEKSGFVHNFVIYRGDDKLSYASYVNNPNVLGFNSLPSKTTKTRESADYTKDININLVNDSSDLYTSAKGDSGHGTCTNDDTAEPLTTVDYTGKAIIKTYSGKERAVDTTVNENVRLRLTTISGDNTCGRQVSSNAEISFNPYIKMTYAGIDNKKEKVYVLGEYQRKIRPNDYAEIQWTQKDENLHVDSQMWALDVNLTQKTDERPWAGSNQVLKGGASYQLTTDKQTVSLNTYQTIVGSNSRAISSITGDYSLTEAEAIEAHNQFVQEATATYDSTEVIQFVSTKTMDDTAWKNGIEVYSGADIKELDNECKDGKASTDKKYYLQSDVNNHANVSRADLDTKTLGTNKKFYRFYSDTEGNIFMVEGNSVAEVESGTGTKVLTKTQNANNLSGMAQFLNYRTLVVTKLLAALERNTGNDKTAEWAPDGAWYNEAYSGVIIMVQRTGVEIKFDRTNERMTVLDPKLVPYIKSKKLQGTQAFLSQYCTNLYDNDVIAFFKGEPVYMYKANLLFNSNKFYITNMTVQDGR